MPPRSKRVPVNKDRWPGVYKLPLAKQHQGKPDVSYYISYKDHHGRKRWEKVGKLSEGYSPQVAAELRAKRLRDARHGEEVKTAKEIRASQLSHDRTLMEVVAHYFDSEIGQNLKGRKTDENRWEKHLKPLLGKRRISTLSELDIERIKRAMRGKAPATVWNTFELLRRFCNYGARMGLCPPLSFVIKMPRRNNEVTEYLSKADYQRLMSVLDSWPNPDVARMLKVALFSGMRRGEIFKLRNQDIDWKHKLVSLEAPKGGRNVTIPLSGVLADIFKEQAAWRDEHYPDSEYVFPGKKGGQRVECTAVRRIKDKAKLPKRFRIFHGLRHHFAVKLANSGQVDLSMIGELLTHKSEAMTKRYAQFLPETKQKAANLAADLIKADGIKETSAFISNEAKHDRK